MITLPVLPQGTGCSHQLHCQYDGPTCITMKDRLFPTSPTIRIMGYMIMKKLFPTSYRYVSGCSVSASTVFAVVSAIAVKAVLFGVIVVVFILPPFYFAALLLILKLSFKRIKGVVQCGDSASIEFSPDVFICFHVIHPHIII